MSDDTLICEFCGKADETVDTIVCGYDVDVRGVDPNSEPYETVCGECEWQHCQDI